MPKGGREAAFLLVVTRANHTRSVVPAFAGTTYALKYAICVLVASSRPFGDHSSAFWSA